MRISLAWLARVVAPCVLSLSAAGDTVVVEPGMSLQDAVAAAQPGDTLLLQPGEYVDSGSLVIDKPLTLLGAGSGLTSYRVVAASIVDSPLPLLVQGIAAGEEVRVIGLSLITQPDDFQHAGVALVLDCAGPVVLADLKGNSVAGDPAFGPLPGAVQVRGSAQVSLAGCAFSAGSIPLGSVAAAGAPGLYVEGSTVAIDATALAGGRGTGDSLDAEGGDGAPALRAVDSLVRVGRGALVGGPGTSGMKGLFVLGLAADGAPGLTAENSTILLRGGPGNTLVGGAGSVGEELGLPDYGAGGPAADLDATSVLTTTSDSALAAGADGDGAVTAPLVTGAGAWTPIAQRLATIRTLPLSAAVGGTSTTELAGEPFGIGVIGFSVGQAPALELPGIAGPVVLNPGLFGTLPALALDAAGEASLTSALPSLPSLAGVTVVLQGLVVNPSGLLSVSTPTAQGYQP